MSIREAGSERPSESAPVLSVLVPAFNEAATIEEILSRVRRVPVSKEIIVVDDGSVDGTGEILRRLAAEDGSIRLLRNEQNRGKGSALRKAIPLARGRICIVQDADLEYDPADIESLIAPIRNGRAAVVYGSRAKHPARDYPWDRFLVGAKVLTFVTNVLYRCWLSDEPTCYKVFETELLKSIPLRSEGFDFCPEVTAKVRKRGVEIVEVPIRYRKRSVAEGKKINWRDGAKGIWALVKFRFSD